MNEKNVNEIELSAVLDMVTYLDNNMTNSMNNFSLQQIYNTAKDRNEALFNNGKIKKDQYEEYMTALNTIEGALKTHPEWQNVTMIDKSRIDVGDTPEWKDDYIQACTFKDGEGNIIVSYRGTGDGRWRDNGDGLVKKYSEMQEKAQEYFDKIVVDYHLEEAHAQGKKIIVTGHSKGGNEAQYVYMMSKYEQLIDNCYSIDGQGFSEDAEANFKSRYSDEYYQLKLKNMYSINGDNDYVHDLGKVIIPEENTYYLRTTGDGINNYHDLNYILCEYDENGELVYKGLLWNKDENGNIIYGEKGPYGKFAEVLSKRVMDIPLEDRRGATVITMDIINKLMAHDKENIGTAEIGFGDWVDFIAHGVPTVIGALLGTEEGREVIKIELEKVKDFVIEKVADFYNNPDLNFIEKAVITGLACVVLPIVATVIAKIVIDLAVVGTFLVILANIVDIVQKAWEKIKEIGTAIGEFVGNLITSVINFFEGIKRWCFEQSAGYKYASNNPYVKLDTSLLRNLASRLESVNRKINSIDSQMDSLYHKLSLIEDFKLQKADMMTKESSRIKKCINYLNNTASDFEDVENFIGSIEAFN